MAKKPKLDPAAFNEAVEFYASKLKLSQKQLKALEKRSRKRGKASAEIVALRSSNAVLKGIEKAVREGASLAETKAALLKKLSSTSTQSVALAFRNGVQTAYNAGRVRQFRDPDVLAVRPYWVFDAVLDMRTSEICITCNHTALRASHPWWRSHIPPLHHACRSTFRAITEEQAQAMGLEPRGPRAPADKGFGRLDALLEPDLSDVDPELLRAAKEKKATRGRR